MVSNVAHLDRAGFTIPEVINILAHGHPDPAPEGGEGVYHPDTLGYTFYEDAIGDGYGGPEDPPEELDGESGNGWDGWASFNPIEQGVYDDDPNPYDGTYSEE